MKDHYNSFTADQIWIWCFYTSELQWEDKPLEMEDLIFKRVLIIDWQSRNKTVLHFKIEFFPKDELHSCNEVVLFYSKWLLLTERESKYL